jgi:hypothetical protein
VRKQITRLAQLGFTAASRAQVQKALTSGYSQVTGEFIIGGVQELLRSQLVQ